MAEGTTTRPASRSRGRITLCGWTLRFGAASEETYQSKAQILHERPLALSPDLVRLGRSAVGLAWTLGAGATQTGKEGLS